MVLLAVLALTGCGSDEGSESADQLGAQVQLDAPLRLADCEDWKAGSVEERLGTIEALQDFAGAPALVPGGRGPVLDEDQAYDLFDANCAQELARGFKLYKLYTRAAGFIGH